MTTPHEHIDGTEYGRRKAFSQIASLGAMALLVWMMAPAIMGEGMEGGGDVIMEHLGWVRRMPWLMMSVIASPMPMLYYMAKRIPRSVRTFASGERFVEGPDWEDVLESTGAAEPRRRESAHENSRSDG